MTPLLRPLRQWAVATVAAAFALLGASQAAAQTSYTPSEEDAVLLQLRAKNFTLGNELRGYQTPGGICVDLADVIQSLDLPIRLDKKSRRATGWIFAEDQTFRIERDSNTVQIMNKSRLLQPGELFDTPEGWCIDTKALSGWFGATFTPDLRNSLLLLESEKPLPLIQAIERQSRAARLSPEKNRDLSTYPQAHQPYALWRLPSVDVVARADYAGSSQQSGRLDTRYEIFASGEVARASYDARLASDSEGKPASLRVRAYRMNPDGQLLGPLKATQVMVGDVEVLPGNLGGGSGVGRGAFVSNRPLQRATQFGSTIVRGVLPLGWDAELYRNGELLAYQGDTVDGRYEFDVKLVYGQNELQVVLYGPQGQIRRESQSISVGYGAVPPGKLEYWAGVVQSGRDLLTFSRPPPTTPLQGEWHYAAGAQYGIDQRTVVGASGHSVVLGGRRRDYGEVELQRSLGPLLLGASAAQELGRGRAYKANLIGRFGKINVQAESVMVDGDFVSGIIAENERATHRIELDTILRAGRIALPLSAGFHRTQTRNGQTVNEVLARGGVVLPRIALTAYVLNRSTAAGFDGPEDGTVVGMLANTRLAGISLRGEAAYRIEGAQRGLSTATVTLEKALSDRSDLRLDIDHAPRTGVTDFQLGYVRQFRKVALTASGHVSTNANLGAGLALSFSLGHDPVSDSWRLSSDKLAQRGEAAVSVFLDEDGDGRRSANEKALAGVGITAGSSGAADPTDAKGHAFVEGLQPYEKVLVSVDESTLPDPFLVPRGKGVVVTPRPGVPAVLELAVAPTAEVEGELTSADGSPAAGVALELLAPDGSVTAQTRSEYDGYFLLDRVTYGTYRLRVAAGSEKALGPQGELARGIELSSKKTLAKLGTLRLRPVTTLAAVEAP